MIVGGGDFPLHYSDHVLGPLKHEWLLDVFLECIGRRGRTFMKDQHHLDTADVIPLCILSRTLKLPAADPNMRYAPSRGANLGWEHTEIPEFHNKPDTAQFPCSPFNREIARY